MQSAGGLVGSQALWSDHNATIDILSNAVLQLCNTLRRLHDPLHSAWSEAGE